MADWTWNGMYQNLYEKVGAIIKDHVCMKFYIEKETLYLETDALGVGVGQGSFRSEKVCGSHEMKCRQQYGETYSICQQAPHQKQDTAK